MKQQKMPKGFKVIKFNIYWIYGAIFLFFLALQFAGTDSAKKTNWQEFNTKMLQPKKKSAGNAFHRKKKVKWIQMAD